MTVYDSPNGPGLAQHMLTVRHRPIRLVFDRPKAAREDPLLPQCVIGSEAVCGGFEFRVLCVSENATLALKEFIGVPCQLQVVTDAGQLRLICGIVTEAASGQSDGGLATYQLVLRDGLAVMESRVNTRIFRNKNELEIIETLVVEWQRSNPVLAATFDLLIDVCLSSRQLPPREFTMQHNESDADFIRRLMQRRGIAWFFRPGLGHRPHSRSRNESERIGHTLVLFDDPYQLKQNAAGSVRFHRDAATEQRDAIDGWSAIRKLQPGCVSLHSWDYRNPNGVPFMAASAPTRTNQGERGIALAASLEEYRVAVPHVGDTLDDLNKLADAQMAHHEYSSKWFKGEGGVRDLAVGEWFSLDGHPEIDTHAQNDRQFVVTSQHIEAQNNLPVEIGARIERLFERNGWSRGQFSAIADPGREAMRYRTSFTCVRRGVRIAPPSPTLVRPQLQTALVVGPENQVVWCDKLGRVKVRFPATRAQDHAHASGAGSADSDADSAWVRVASSWAGNGTGSNQCGTRFLPPVGTEVLIDFAGGDPDKPIIVGQLYNGRALPPVFQHEDALATTRYQSGIRSREVHGQRGNQLRLDDTTGQISAQLASDHAKTELNLGYLTEPRQNGDADPRGEGAELRTEEAIALRAARGILLSAWKLLGGRSKGGQLARDDYLALLQECGELCTSLGNYAAEHNGLPIDCKEQDALLARFKKWDDGSNVEPRAAAPREPVIGVTSDAGIGFASSKAIVSYSARNIDSAAQQHMQFTAGQRFTLNAGKGISLFASNGGLSAIAHNGKLLLQSQNDDTTVNSAKNVQLTASEGMVTIAAKAIVLVAEDGSFIKLGEGSPVFGSKQPLKFHAPDFIFDGAESMTASLPTFTAGGADQRFELRYPKGVADEDGNQPPGAIVKNAKINVSLSDGTEVSARSGTDGKSELLARDAMHIAEVEVLRGGEQ